MSRTRMLVVGGGFAGVKTTLELAKSEHFDITLISDQAYFCYYPTLYHMATGGTAAESAIPLAKILAGKRIKLVLGKATHINRTKKTLKTADGILHPYDILVLSLGSIPNYFGIQGIEKYAHSINSPGAARRFKDHLHSQLTAANKPDLNYVIVGGGPTGIELAGALPHYLRRTMQAHGIRHRAIHVDLVEAAPKLLPRMPKTISRAVSRRLRRLGINLYLGRTVEGETADALMVNGKPIQSHTVVWTAGTTLNPFFSDNHFETSPRRKVIVDEYLQAEPDIFVMGDNAETQYSGMAQTALHDAHIIAENMIRKAEGRLMEPYKPKEPIYVIPAGPGWAAVLWGNVQLFGRAGWVLRSLADLRAYADYEPWWRAGEQWLTELETEEDCPICTEHRTAATTS